MADPRTLEALRRIERAVARLEAAAARLSDSGEGGGEDGQRLRQAHDSLRRQVAGAIGQIDRMIASGERR